MPKTSKKRSHKQGTGNERARTRADQEVTTSNGESAKQVVIRETFFLFEGFFALAKGHGLRFFFDDME